MNIYEVENFIINSTKAEPLDPLVVKIKRDLRKYFKGVEVSILKKLDTNGVVTEQDVNSSFGVRTAQYEVAIIASAERTIEFQTAEGLKQIENITDTIIAFDKISPLVSSAIINRRLSFTDKTLRRIPSEVNVIIQAGYELGLGEKQIGAMIREEFSHLSEFEANRIARTEVHSASSETTDALHKSLDVVEYEMWWTASDERVRDGSHGSANHVVLHGQIVKKGNPFVTGDVELSGPHDPKAPAGQTINCRCNKVAFFMPTGFIAPDLPYFYEGDLIAIS